MKPAGIVWLASYPKSGNTWFRVFLAHLVGEREVRLNELSRALDCDLTIASERDAFDELAGLDASDLLPDEIDRLRPPVYRAVARRHAGPAFVKVHDAWLPTSTGEPMLPPDATRAVIYLVRNPLDVAVSLAFHANLECDEIIRRMADRDYVIGFEATRLHAQLRQRLSSWSGHVASWLDAPGIDRLVLRYEDMVLRPLETFGAAARFIGRGGDPELVRRAIDGARFDRLSAQETETGFIEKPRQVERFFRSGRVGDWRDHLSDAQTARIVADHGAMMRRLDYLDRDGRPAF